MVTPLLPGEALIIMAKTRCGRREELPPKSSVGFFDHDGHHYSGLTLEYDGGYKLRIMWSLTGAGLSCFSDQECDHDFVETTRGTLRRFKCSKCGFNFETDSSD